MDLSSHDIEMLRGLNFAHVVTLDPDGAPHSAPTWIDVDDEGRVMVNSAVGRRKDRNIRRDPRVAVSVHRQDDPYTWLSIQGTVVSIETGEEAEVHIDTLNRRYMNGAAWTYVEGQQRVIYRIRADKVMRSN
jgi:PPOX class probable F420-dependent enzyme